MVKMVGYEKHIGVTHFKILQNRVQKVSAIFDREGDDFEKMKKGKRGCNFRDNSEYLVWNTFKANAEKRIRVFIECKYGPLRTLRRGQTFKLRKELIEKKEFENAYIKFPAILMARKDGSDNYTVVKGFSGWCFQANLCWQVSYGKKFSREENFANLAKSAKINSFSDSQKCRFAKFESFFVIQCLLN